MRIPDEILKRSESMEDFDNVMSGRDVINKLTKRIEYLEMVVDKHIDFECNCCGKVIKREQGYDINNQFLCGRCYEEEWS